MSRPLPRILGPEGSQNVRTGFYGLVVAIYLSLVGGLAVFVIKWNHPASVALFGVLSLLFLGTSYGLARQIAALSLRNPSVLARLEQLGTRPRVAILYTTMNDVVPECLGAIRQHYPVDIYILDDSSDPRVREVVDSISSEHGYRVARRPHRRGFKAGAINDWLRASGLSYDYLVLLDADSYLPPDWVGEALRYAEDSHNARVAVFQGLINIWNMDTKFVRTLAPLSRVGQFLWEENLANHLDAVFCFGHNVLVRISAIREIGNFVEGYVSEDFATACALAERNWHSRFLPLHTYEATPENVRGFIKRQNKWTRGAMEFFAFSRRYRLRAGQKFDLLQTPFGHVTNLLLPLGMLLTVYGYTSTSATTARFLSALLANPAGTFWSVPILRYLLVIGILTSIPLWLVLRHCRISFRTYWHHRWLSSAVSMVALPYEFLSMIAYLGTRLRSIPVTPKNEALLTLREVLHLSRYSLVLLGALLLGILLFNPLAAIFNATWLVPMAFAPLVIWGYGGGATYFHEVPLSEGWGEPSAQRAEPREVRLFLNARRRSLLGSQAPTVSLT